MRTKLFKIAQAATLGFAITLTLSCSGGDDPDNGNGGGGGGGNTSGSNLSDLPKQAYIVVEDNDGNIIKKDEYKSTSNITLRISLFADYDCSSSGSTCICTDYSGVEHQCTMDELDGYESKPAGKIQNGQVLLDLPDIDSKYLEGFDLCDEYDTECNISIIPENLVGFKTKILYVTIQGKSDCQLVAVLKGVGYKPDNGKVYLSYYSVSGKITGRSCSSSWGHCDDGYDNYNLNFSKGWNVYYRYYIDAETRNHTSDLPKTGGTLEWWIVCNDN